MLCLAIMWESGTEGFLLKNRGNPMTMEELFIMYPGLPSMYKEWPDTTKEGFSFWVERDGCIDTVS